MSVQKRSKGNAIVLLPRTGMLLVIDTGTFFFLQYRFLRVTKHF